MTSIQLKEKHFSSFFKAPFKVYGKQYPFCSPLRSELKAMLSPQKNPLFQNASGTYYTAFRDGEIVGRISTLVHHSANQRFDELSGSFGFFDCIDDLDVAQKLLTAAEEFALSHKCNLLRGNMELTANQEIGVLTKGEQKQPFLAQVYNPEYIPLLLEQCGYQKGHPMTTFVKSDIQTYDPSILIGKKHQQLMDDPAYTFRSFRIKHFDQEVESIRQVLNAAMADNYLFVPLSKDEASFQLQPLKMVLDPELLQIAEHEGQVIGVTMCVPDVNGLLRSMKSRLFPFGWLTFLLGKKKIRDASVIIILAKPNYQSKGIIRILTYRMLKSLKKGGYQKAGGTWIGDDNIPSLKSAEATNMKPYHRTHIFEKKLT